jgi:large subunit ribosomal protein L10
MSAKKLSANQVKKQSKVEDLGGDLQQSELVVVLQQSGLNADETRNLRVQMRQAGVSAKVGKNTLIKLAIKGTKLEGISAFLKGPTLLAYSKDPIAAAKVAAEFAKKNDKLKIIGASMNGNLLDAKNTMALATLPSLDELRGKLVGLLVAPATRIAGVLQAPAGQLARVMVAKAKQ